MSTCKKCGMENALSTFIKCWNCGQDLSELPSSTGSVDLRKLQLAIELELEGIERILPNHKLTLIAKYHGARPLKDADILMTKDTPENMLAVIERFYPSNSDFREPAK